MHNIYSVVFSNENFKSQALPVLLTIDIIRKRKGQKCSHYARSFCLSMTYNLLSLSSILPQKISTGHKANISIYSLSPTSLSLSPSVSFCSYIVQMWDLGVCCGSAKFKFSSHMGDWRATMQFIARAKTCIVFSWPRGRNSTYRFFK